jgi:hypothetical protein
MSPALPYQVSWSAGSMESIKRQSRALPSSEIRNQPGRLLRAINERLRRDPLDFGEIYRKRGSVSEFVGVLDWASVDYSVDIARSLVFVRTCNFLSRPGVEGH